MTSLDIRHTWRSDIQGLRGVAILFVVFGHLFPTLLPGGFIGVDLFFVISGYVITSQLQSLWAADQKKVLTTFYFRRVRRILPSALLVLFTTVLAAHILLGPIFKADATRDGFWASIFLANFHFAHQSQDYFSTGAPQSLLQHYWSLSIEEQFYLIWPIILLFILSRRLAKQGTLITVGSLTLLSFAFCMANIYLFDNLNFFNSSARAWQLLAGCLISLVNLRLSRTTELKVISAIILVIFAFTLDETMRWPNLSTLLVIISAALLCLPSGDQRLFLLESPTLIYIGDLSYLLYLWHWPVLMITKNYFSDFQSRHIFLVLILTVVLSIISHYLVEKPLRQSRLLVALPRITIVSGISALFASALTLRYLL